MTDQPAGPDLARRLAQALVDAGFFGSLIVQHELRRQLQSAPELARVREALEEAIVEAKYLDDNTDPLVDRILTPALRDLDALMGRKSD